MNLIVDIGNTLVKAAVIDGDKLLTFHSGADANPNGMLQWIKEFNIHSGICCSVRNNPDDWLKIIGEKIRLLEMNQDLKIPLTVKYETPASLGPDRLALACGAQHHFKNKNTLVISAGTCITFDFTDKEKNYLGGSISPGVQMRLKAMHEFTSKLPLAIIQPSVSFLGNNTERSLLAGAIRGAAAEVDGLIGLYQTDFQDTELILTGGGASVLEGYLKNKTFAAPHILLQGLNQIAELNVN